MLWTRVVNLGSWCCAFALTTAGCGGVEVTSLPGSEEVSANPSQLCDDIGNFIENLAPQIGPLVCASAVQSGSDCQNLYSECLAAYSGATNDPAFASTIDMGLKNCSTELAQCNGIKVSQVSACISDLANVYTNASNAITPEKACSGKGFSFPSPPKSCTSLPANCAVAGSSVSVSGP